MTTAEDLRHHRPDSDHHRLHSDHHHQHGGLVIDAVGLSKSFRARGGDPTELLSGATLQVAPWTTVAVMGRSGAGKSTLLRALGLFQPFDAGRYRLLGRDVAGLSDRACSALRARHIGFVFQEFRLLPHLTATANVEVAAALAGVPARSRRREAQRALDLVGLSHRLRARPRTLSGGEQQRVALARALVKRPSLILADEPTGALDDTTAAKVLEILRHAVATSAAALVVVTHDPVVATACDRQLRLQDGQLLPLLPDPDSVPNGPADRPAVGPSERPVEGSVGDSGVGCTGDAAGESAGESVAGPTA
jgi:putative ABC transport system ATP-binding protein